VATHADGRNADMVADSLARAASTRALPADAAHLKEFGLEPPAITVEIGVKKGAAQKLELGAKDFSDMNVYVREAGAKDVLLVPASILSDVSRPLSELRDRSTLQLGAWQLTELDFHTPKAKFRVEKKADYWDITEPRNAPADGDDIDGLRTSISTEKFSDVVEEDAKDAAAPKFGFANPELTVHVRNEQGNEGTLIVGKKDGDKYFARDASRSMIFHVNESLVKKFADTTFATLRSKRALRAKAEDFTHLSVHNEKGTIAASASGEKWLVEEPADRKGKNLNASKVFDPLLNLRAKEVLDPPSAAIAAKLAKPTIEIKLTGKDGAVITVSLVQDGSDVYLRTSQSPAVLKFESYLFSQLNFTAEEAAP